MSPALSAGHHEPLDEGLRQLLADTMDQPWAPKFHQVAVEIIKLGLDQVYLQACGLAAGEQGAGCYIACAVVVADSN